MAKNDKKTDDNMGVLREEIRKQEFRPAYLLYGEESYLVQDFRRRLKDALVGSDQMNYASYSGKNLNLQEIRDLSVTMPFFAERRLLLFEETGLFSGDAGEFPTLFDSLPDTTHLVFVENSVDRRSRMYKKLAEKGLCCSFYRQTRENLRRWIASGFGSMGLRITDTAAERLLDYVGEDMGGIRMEMDKLAAYCIEKGFVEEKDIEALCTERPENRIFEMVENVSRGLTGKALAQYSDLVTLKESPLGILFLVGRQMNQLLTIREMEKERKSRDEIAAQMKLHSFVVQKLSSIGRAFTEQELKAAVECCVASEEAVKTGKMSDRVAVETLIMALSGRVFGNTCKATPAGS